MINEWERVKELLTAIDARLRAFTDRDVRYYLREDFACVSIYAVMLVPKMEKMAAMQLVVSRITLQDARYWDAERVAHAYIHAWIEKIKFERKYEELNVVFDAPPGWAMPVDLEAKHGA